MRFRYLIAMGPTVTVTVCRLMRSLTLASMFDLVFKGRGLVLELRNVRLSSLEFPSKLGIGGGQGATVPRSDDVSVANWAISSTVSCIVSSRPFSITILAL
jgi:hypothetical protein